MKMIMVNCDGQCFRSLKVDQNINLKLLREKLNENKYSNKKLNDSQLFVSGNHFIEKKKEESIKLSELLQGGTSEIHISSKVTRIDIVINNSKEKISKNIPSALSLSSLRNLDPSTFPLHLNFFKNNQMINLLDETKLKISDIMIKNTISIGQSSEEQKLQQYQYEKQQQEIETPEFKQKQSEKVQTKNIKKTKKQSKNDKQETKQQSTINNSIESKEIQINLLLDRQKKLELFFDIHNTLSQLREACKSIHLFMDFTWKNAPIYEEDENQILVSEVLEEAFQSAYTIINKKKNKELSGNNFINIIWLSEKQEYYNGKGIENAKQSESIYDKSYCSLEQYLNIDSIYINELPKNAILDPDGNPADSKFDLGKDGAFTKFSILIGAFAYSKDLEDTAMLALKGKGFKVDRVLTEKEFIDQLPHFDQAWILSGYKDVQNQTEFVEAIRKHLEQRKGLMLWADNDPLYVHSNLILSSLDDPILSKIKLEGNDLGRQTLIRSQSDTPTTKSFIQHQITTGLFKQKEGITICYPVLNQKQLHPNYKIIGVGSAGRPCYACIEASEKRGRIIIDCAFTKLWKGWWNGNWRYVRNCAVWLLGLDSDI